MTTDTRRSFHQGFNFVFGEVFTAAELRILKSPWNFPQNIVGRTRCISFERQYLSHGSLLWVPLLSTLHTFCGKYSSYSSTCQMNLSSLRTIRLSFRSPEWLSVSADSWKYIGSIVTKPCRSYTLTRAEMN